jgi:predicted DNA-binding protein (UPF0251 family)
MAYTLGEATKATGISKTTLQRAVKSGKVSATKTLLACGKLIPPNYTAFSRQQQTGTVPKVTYWIKPEQSMK